MPPKVRITKAELVTAAVALVRSEGVQALNARSLAAALHCSTQPVFSNFSTMEALRDAVVTAADDLCREYMRQETEQGVYPPYKASGMAYIRFAKDEPELFKLLYMRNRNQEAIPEQTDIDNQMEALVRGNTGLMGQDAKLFHLEMWAYVHGIAVMFATGYLDLDWPLVSKMLTDAFQGLRKQHETE